MDGTDNRKDTELMIEYLTGVLAAHDRELVEARMARDTGFARALESFRRVWEAGGRLQAHPPTPPMSARLRALLDEENGRGILRLDLDDLEGLAAAGTDTPPSPDKH